MPILRRYSALTAALLVTASCASESPVNNCFDGKCDGTGTDPFKGLGDIESRTFEYIVIGSGAGGGPLAANLARQGHSVLLLEAGKETGGKTESSVPVLHPTSTETPDLAWWYFVNHYSDANRQALDTKHTTEGILYPRGGVLGGSTAVNAMITVAPKNSDWDQIASLTNDASWRASNMAQYYERVQRWLSIEHQQVDLATLLDNSIGAILAGTFMFAADHGIGGPHVDPDNPLANVAAMFEFLLHDINAEIMAGPGTQGVFMFPLATKDHKRNGTREYLLRTMRDARRFPLRIKTQALVTKITFDGKDGSGNWRANGVDFLDGESLYSADLTAANAPASPKLVHAKASKEVIVAAGAFNTPQLLMLSGIGDGTHLKSKGIDVKVDNPAVGTNLQDRYEVGVVSELSTDFTAVQRCTFTYDENDRCYLDWLLRKGPYTSNGSALSILMKSDANKPESDLHIFALPGVFKGYYPGYSTDANKDLHHLSWVILKGHTQNTAGTVRLKSSDPRERPDINFHYFDDGSVDQGQDVNDLTALVNAVEYVRDLAARSDAVDKFTTYTERWPGSVVQSRAQIGDWIKKEAWGHHASCSAPIGKVLESDFRVKGTANLRVVDASVFPKIPGTFIVLPIYMVSEKAFDVILKKNNEPRKSSNFL